MEEMDCTLHPTSNFIRVLSRFLFISHQFSISFCLPPDVTSRRGNYVHQIFHHVLDLHFIFLIKLFTPNMNRRINCLCQQCICRGCQSHCTNTQFYCLKLSFAKQVSLRFNQRIQQRSGISNSPCIPLTLLNK